ncbi:multiheme c-type cytochrome [Zavarzinia sp. CC-PAN008]|uniref:multiheme c-type cytochrome n=1 Tax=Zavarzinia sp. CC-PAN008 TaxID=3243332 RepID=UPI003F7464F5
MAVLTLSGMLSLGTAGGAQAQTAVVLPQNQDAISLGNTTCAGSTCHAAAQPLRNSTVLQNEFSIWSTPNSPTGAHSRAYKILEEPRSVRIAQNLGLPDAKTAKICLDCHAYNVVDTRRGRQFNIADGVACEACHGPGQNWLGSHVSGATHAQNIAAGLFPTEEPIARAELCLSCHFGNDEKFVDHKIMGAGHPRIKFELDNFTWIQAHHAVDEDYRQRKVVVSGVKTWAIGQAMQIDYILRGLLDPKRGRGPYGVEIVFYDCQSCHHAMTEVRWTPRASTGLPPGVPRLNDSNLIMLRVLANAVDPALATKLSEQSLALHKASTEGPDAVAAAAKVLQETTKNLVQEFAAHEFGKAEIGLLIKALIEQGAQGELVDYMAAEQAYYALASLIDTAQGAGYITEEQATPLRAALDKCVEALGTAETVAPGADGFVPYRPTVYAEALRGVAASLPAL